MSYRARAQLAVLGVGFLDATMSEALATLAAELQRPAGPPARTVYFVNAATLNLASQDLAYRQVLNSGDYVFGDGVGARVGARLLHGVRLRDNVNGTDLTPHLFAATAGRGHRYFLLGATAEAIVRAAAQTQRLFPGWHLAGYHHGYLTTDRAERTGAGPDQRFGRGPAAGGHGQPAAGELDPPAPGATEGAAGHGGRGPVHLLGGGFDSARRPGCGAWGMNGPTS